MKIVVEESDRELVREALKNLPEYSFSYLKCHGWDNKKCEYDFTEDTEEDGPDRYKEHTLTLDKAFEGFKKLVDLMQNGKFHCGLGVEDLQDAGNWDADVVDGMVQCALLGEVVYG